MVGPTREIAAMRVRTWSVVAAGLVAGLVGLAAPCAAGDAPPEAVPPTPPAADDRTDVVLTADVPIREGRNVLWCATTSSGGVTLAATSRPPPFEVAFHRRGSPLRFGPGVDVRAFGLVGADRGRDARVRAGQVVMHLAPDGPRDDDDPSLVVSLRPQGTDERVVLARGGRAATLAARWRRVRAYVEHGTAIALRPGDATLWIPQLELTVGVPRTTDGTDAPERAGTSATTTQVRFRVDGRGDRAATTDNLVADPWCRSPSLSFDEPFLLAVVRAATADPSLLAWVGNDAWLEPWPAFEPLPDPWRRRLAGAWVLDVDGTAARRARLMVSISGQVADAETAEERAAYARALASWAAKARDELVASAYALTISDDVLTTTTPTLRTTHRLGVVDGALAMRSLADAADVAPVRLDGDRVYVGSLLVFRRP